MYRLHISALCWTPSGSPRWLPPGHRFERPTQGNHQQDQKKGVCPTESGARLRRRTSEQDIAARALRTGWLVGPPSEVGFAVVCRIFRFHDGILKTRNLSIHSSCCDRHRKREVFALRGG